MWFKANVHSACAYSPPGQVCTPRVSIPTLGLPLMPGRRGGPPTNVVQKARGLKTPAGNLQPMLNGA